jgi:hypothetical protein
MICGEGAQSYHPEVVDVIKCEQQAYELSYWQKSPASGFFVRSSRRVTSERRDIFLTVEVNHEPGS